MRWNAVITLVGLPNSYQDGEGVWHDSDVPQDTVFCNVMSVGGEEWFRAKEAGLMADAKVQVHSIDYSGQEQVILEGRPYTVERVARRGDFVTLTLGRRYQNG